MEYYEWIKACHLVSVIAWMAGMLYLPRLYVYHATASVGGELSETLKIMERRLLRAIINPAMIAATVFGSWLLFLNPALLHMPFMHAKFTLLVLMGGVHGLLSRHRKSLARDERLHSARYYRILNEVPTVLMIGIVLLIIVKPFAS